MKQPQFELYVVGSSKENAWEHCHTPWDDVEAAREFAADNSIGDDELFVYAMQCTGPTDYEELEEL